MWVRGEFYYIVASIYYTAFEKKWARWDHEHIELMASLNHSINMCDIDGTYYGELSEAWALITMAFISAAVGITPAASGITMSIFFSWLDLFCIISTVVFGLAGVTFGLIAVSRRRKATAEESARHAQVALNLLAESQE